MTVPGKLAMNILVGLLWVVTMAGCNTDADQDCIPCPEEPPQAQPLGQEISRHFSEAFPTLAGSLFNLPLEVKLSLMEGDYREKAIAAGKTVAELNIEPGSRVLDIGAGSGILAFELAREVGPEGKVFATDVDPEMIEILHARASRGGHTNVRPVMVSPVGVDPFYKQHEFDVIIAFQLILYLPDLTAYFGELRGSLDREKGRLIIGREKHVARFHSADFRDLPAVVRTLGELAPEHPLVSRLDPELVIALNRANVTHGAPTDLADLLAVSFNKILDDNLFFLEVENHCSSKVGFASESLRFVPAEEGAITKWLVYAFEETGLFEEPGRIMNNQEKYAVAALNKIILQGLFGDSIATATISLPKALYRSPATVVKQLAAAGYRLVRTYDFLPYFDVMEFVPK